MTRRQQRLRIILLCGLGLGTAVALSLAAFQDNLVFFRSPGDIAAAPPADGRAFRLGGLVEAGSVERGVVDGRPVAIFRVTDGAHTIGVTYTGVLPDLFREGQGVVTLGKLRPDGGFTASEVLARHDESYMPPEVADALKRSGRWNPADGPAPAAGDWNMLRAGAAAASVRPGAGDQAPAARKPDDAFRPSAAPTTPATPGPNGS